MTGQSNRNANAGQHFPLLSGPPRRGFGGRTAVRWWCVALFVVGGFSNCLGQSTQSSGSGGFRTRGASSGSETHADARDVDEVPAFLKDANRPAAPGEIQETIKRLGADRFAQREKAGNRLRQIGMPAAEQLYVASEDDSDLEIRFRCRDLYRQIMNQHRESLRNQFLNNEIDGS
ncbi:MAG: hypothetical protein AAFP69_03155, partial [Planctomycetota bacterium]